MKTSKMRVYLVLLFINKPIICNLSKKKKVFLKNLIYNLNKNYLYKKFIYISLKFYFNIIYFLFNI